MYWQHTFEVVPINWHWKLQFVVQEEREFGWQMRCFARWR